MVEKAERKKRVQIPSMLKKKGIGVRFMGKSIAPGPASAKVMDKKVKKNG